jgi:Phage tail tube protein
MSSADLLRIGLVREATPGVTPATPVFQLLRVTSESLAFNPDTQLSNELAGASRQVTDVIVTGGQSNGDIAFELSSNPGFEMLLEAVLANTWGGATPGGDEIWVGNKLLTHTIEKRFTINEADGDPLARYEYNRVVRALVDAMTLTFAPGGPATGSATILGGAFSRDSSDLAGATYNDAGKLPVIVGAGILPVTFTVDGTDYSAWCVSNLVVNFRNNGRAIACLGQEAANEVVLGRFECEITADIYLNKETKAVMDAFLDRDEIAFAFSASDAQDNAYDFDFPRVRVSAATEVAAGTNQDVIVSVTMQALVDDVTLADAVTAVETCVLITRDHVTTPWPGA